MPETNLSKDGMTTLFVITYGRSGSTLLQTLLNNMPGVLIRGENNLALAPLIESWWRLVSSKRDYGRAYNKMNEPWYGIADVDTDAYARAMVDAFCAQVLRPQPETRIMGYKEIRYNTLGPRLDRLVNFVMTYFPDPKIIFNTRDSASVAKSGWFRNHPEQETLDKIAAADLHFATLQEKYADRAITVRYENLIGGPEEAQKIADFLGVSLEPETLARVMGEQLNH